MQEARIGVDLGVDANPELNVALELGRARDQVVVRHGERQRAPPRRSEREQESLTADVGFIYTPVSEDFDCAFNELPEAMPGRSRPAQRLAVDDLDNTASALPRGWRPPVSYREREALHIGRCVTVEPRRSYNMSHRRACGADWHRRCFVPSPEAATSAGRKEEQLADSRKTGPAWTHSPTTRPVDRITTKRDSSKPSKRPSKPRSAGFFFAWLRSRKGTWATCLPGRPVPSRSPALRRLKPHLESPQFRQVMQPSIMTTAAVLHLAHSCAPSGKWDLAKASVCLARASNSARFSSTSFCWCSSRPCGAAGRWSAGASR